MSRTCRTCKYNGRCDYGCNNYIQKQSILDKLYEVLQDNKLHSYSEIAERVWQSKLDSALVKSIRVEKLRLQKKHNLVIKTKSGYGLQLIGKGSDIYA